MVFSKQENVEQALGENIRNKMKLDELDTLYHLLCAENPEKVIRKHVTIFIRPYDLYLCI